MMPPDTQPVNVVCFSFKQQQSSNKWQVVTSGQVNGQLSHQQKHGCNLQQQCSQCGSFSWQQPLQSVHVSHPQPLLQELHELEAPQLGSAVVLQLGAALLQLGAALLQLGAAALLQLLLSDAAGAGAGAAGAAGVACADAL
jgi:hypothetical protein